MINIKRIIFHLIVKLAVGATIFLIVGKLINPEKPIFNEGIYGAIIGLAIFFIGEAIWKIYQQHKNPQK